MWLGVLRSYSLGWVWLGGEGGDYVSACTECVEYLDGLLATVRVVFLVCVYVPCA